MAATHLHPLTSKALMKLNCEICRTRQFIVEHGAILSTIRRISIDNIFIHTLPTLKFSVPGLLTDFSFLRTSMAVIPCFPTLANDSTLPFRYVEGFAEYYIG